MQAAAGKEAAGLRDRLAAAEGGLAAAGRAAAAAQGSIAGLRSQLVRSIALLGATRFVKAPVRWKTGV